HYRDVGIENRVEPLDPTQVGVGHFDGGDGPRAQQRAESRYVDLRELGHAFGPGVERSGGSTPFRSPAGKRSTCRASPAYQSTSAVASLSASAIPKIRRTSSALIPCSAIARNDTAPRPTSRFWDTEADKDAGACGSVARRVDFDLETGREFAHHHRGAGGAAGIFRRGGGDAA